ncbi:hypothetical protein IFM89_015989 [Coptis chinensis]|uniref:Cytochrome b561 and DOMON domain-containing protein n=1 Tax=Coptis chinensis TaxID=261450 RepID=A0A835HQ45_9MAGN|nr:hypothetical protein IFM89_015989 [Coptis chinensis]
MADLNRRRAIGLSVYYVLVYMILFLNTRSFSVVGQGENVVAQLCANDLSSFLPVPYSNLSDYKCRAVWNTYILRVSRSADNVLTCVLSAAYTTGWVGIGFSKDGMMIGASAMVGWIGKEGRANIKQYYLRGFTPSNVIPDKGELQLTNVPPAVVINGATIYLAFQLKVEEVQKSQPILLAFGTKTPAHHQLSVHDDKTAILYDFSGASWDNINTPSSVDNVLYLRRNHGVLAIIGWGVLLPAGAIVARYLRHRDPLWYYLHVSIQFVGFIIGLATVVAGKVVYERMHAMVPTHRGIGFFVLVLSILQIMAFFLRPDRDSKIRRYWNLYHHWFGRLALFMAALNILLGIQAGGGVRSWNIVYAFILSVILVTVIILEVLLQRENLRNHIHQHFR